MSSTYLEFPANLSSNNQDVVEDDTRPELAMKFLNYMPMNKNLKQGQFNPANRTKEIEAHYKYLMNEIISDYLTEERKPLNILPKKSNNDLKRALNKKFAKLNKRTEIAIVELLREKISGININKQNQEEVKPEAVNKGGKSKRDDVEYESGEDEKADYEEERNDEGGASLLEKMQLQEKALKESDDEDENRNDDQE